MIKLSEEDMLKAEIDWKLSLLDQFAKLWIQIKELLRLTHERCETETALWIMGRKFESSGQKSKSATTFPYAKAWSKAWSSLYSEGQERGESCQGTWSLRVWRSHLHHIKSEVTSALDHPPLLSHTTSRELVWKWPARTQTGIHMGCWDLRMKD